MYTPVVGQSSDPTRLRGIEEWIPEQLQGVLPSDPAKILVWGVGALILVSIVFGGGVTTGRRR